MKKDQKHISILLGAGFSANQGYPIGNKLNDLLVNCKEEDLSFSTDGSLIPAVDGKKQFSGYRNSYENEFDFFRTLVQYFKSIKGNFDYEEFYDFIEDAAHVNSEVKVISKKYSTNSASLGSLLHGARHVLNQLVSYYLRDKDGKQYYDNVPHIGKPSFERYTGILNCIEKLGEEHIVHVHTLNHDLFFERMNITDWLRGRLSDGFQELGSPYYGEINKMNSKEKVRLDYYTGNYNSTFRLYKLHGSLNYAVFHSPVDEIGLHVASENYVKIKWGINMRHLYKEIERGGKLTYHRDILNFNADFLTGTSSKIERYTEPLLYQKLFEHFRENLQQSEKLIIIGYGGKDTEINKMLVNHFDFKNKPSYIIDPNPGQKISALREDLNSKLITKDLEEITNNDIS